MRSSPLLPALLLGACAGEPEFEAHGCDPTAQSGDGVSYEPEDMACVQVSMDDGELEELMDQFRFAGGVDDQWPGIIAATAMSCSEPYPDGYTYFSADVSVDGWETSNVGIRKKGFIGSVIGAGSRPSLKVKTDEFVDHQTLGDTERITLNNNLQDLTRFRTCLTYSVFADADYPAPLCNLANVSVNDQPLGAYTHVESPKKRFLRRNFGNDDGSLYEGTLADFTDAHLAGLPDTLGRWEAKTSDTDPSGTGLLRVTKALQAGDDDLEYALGNAIDLDAFMQFWALETLVNHVDGYGANTNNFFVYFDPDRGGLGVFIPWGADDTFAGWEPNKVTAELTRRLSRHPELHQRYLDELQILLDEVWDEDVLDARIDAFTEQVESAEPSSEQRRDDVRGIRSWVAKRRKNVQRFIDGGGELGNPQTGACTGNVDPDDFLLLAEVATVASATCSTAPSSGVGALIALFILGLRRMR